MARTLRLGLWAAAIAMGAPPSAIRPDDVVNHLERTIAWYRKLQAAEQASTDVLVRQSIHQTSLQALQLAFDFAHSEAGLLAAAAQAPQNGGAPASGNLQQASSRAVERVN